MSMPRRGDAARPAVGPPTIRVAALVDRQGEQGGVVCHEVPPAQQHRREVIPGPECRRQVERKELLPADGDLELKPRDEHCEEGGDPEHLSRRQSSRRQRQFFQPLRVAPVERVVGVERKPDGEPALRAVLGVEQFPQAVPAPQARLLPSPRVALDHDQRHRQPLPATWRVGSIFGRRGNRMTKRVCGAWRAVAKTRSRESTAARPLICHSTKVVILRYSKGSGPLVKWTRSFGVPG